MATFFKNTELAAKYNISEATVRNWIKSAREGRLDLELIESGDHIYVADSIRNISIVKRLIAKNRKYRNSLTARTVAVRPELLRTFTESQVYDIARNLEMHGEIPRQYGYFGEGAVEWDEYIEKQATAATPSLLRGTIDMLKSNRSFIDSHLAKFKKVKVVDVGVGNAMPVKDLLTHLIARGKLGRYVALDFSEDMTAIAKRNLKRWFGEDFPFESYQFDMAYERFANIIAEDYLANDQDTMNLVLLFGGTPANLRVPDDAFRTICESMNPQDLLLYTDWDEFGDSAPEWLVHSYDVQPQKPELLYRHRYVLDMLNVTNNLYTVEVGFDSVKGMKYARARLKYSLAIRFEFATGEHVVRFEKGDTILLWRSWKEDFQKIVERLDKNGFRTIHVSRDKDNYILAIAEVQRG